MLRSNRTRCQRLLYKRRHVMIIMQKAFVNTGLVVGFSGLFHPREPAHYSSLTGCSCSLHRACPDLGISLLLYEQWLPGVYSTPPDENSYEAANVATHEIEALNSILTSKYQKSEYRTVLYFRKELQMEQEYSTAYHSLHVRTCAQVRTKPCVRAAQRVAAGPTQY
jgi:hypothetical protein